MKKRKALGKGLSAIIPEAEGFEEKTGQFFLCPIELIEPNPDQPRKDFSEPELQEMVNSVKEKGVITPLLVSRKDNIYQLIAGERRWRAAQRGGLDRVPVIVKEASPTEVLELALIENIHRKDLNPIEEALAFKKLITDAGITQDELAKRIGKERSTVTNIMRLLSLPLSMQEDVINGRLSMGHARVLAGLKSSEERISLRDEIINRDLSVRQAESLAKKAKSGSPKGGKPDSEKDYYFRSLADNLKRSLGTKVEIRRNGKRGRIVVHYYSDDELDRLLELLC